MSNRGKLKEELRKIAKRRQQRKANVVARGPADQLTSGSDPGSSVPESSDGNRSSKTAQSLDVIAKAILVVDRAREDVSDRDVLIGLKSVLRGYPTNDSKVQAVYHAVVETRDRFQLQAHPMRAAIDKLLDIIRSYDSTRESPRSALTYLHSLSS
jgi:hypothetical protein